MLLLGDSHLHRLDPFAIQFTPDFGLRWYGLAYAAGFVAAWWILRWFGRTGRSPLTPKGAGDLMTLVIIGVLVGGRLGWAIFYWHGAPIISFTSEFPYWDLLRIHKGGMASHGGMLGVIAVCWLYGRRHGIPSLHLMDMGALVCTVGLFLGRLANFVNGELPGKRLPAADQTNIPGAPPGDPPWWSVKYPQEILDWPTEKLAALGPSMPEIGVAPERWAEWLQRQAYDRGAAQQVGETLQALIDAVRDGNTAIEQSLAPMLTAYHPSQLVQAITDGPILGGLLVLIWLRPRRPGVVGCWFLVIYGVLRILTEIVRQPDEGVALLAGLSRGQVLSILMIVAGLIMLPMFARRPVERLGGFLRARA